jgi:putative tryptophan/tyrosine transport system substrate-binding protein
MIGRREFIALLGGAAAAWPLAARAQQAVPVIGFVHSARPAAHLVDAFRRGLGEIGYVEGRNVAIEFRSAEGRDDRLPDLMADLVRRRVALIVAQGGDITALAAKTATTTIPIVFNVDRDPAQLGLVDSLSRPGGNATGVNQLVTELGAKCLGLLHSIVRGDAIIALLKNPAFHPTQDNIDNTEAAARALGRRLQMIAISNEREFDPAFADMVRDRVGALVVAPDPFFFTQRERLIALAAQHTLPTLYVRREFALAGGLMSYGTSLTDVYRQVALYSGRILKGEKPADLPVVQSTRFELVLNLKTAKALGFDFPPTLLAIADEVIE